MRRLRLIPLIFGLLAGLLTFGSATAGAQTNGDSSCDAGDSFTLDVMAANGTWLVLKTGTQFPIPNANRGVNLGFTLPAGSYSVETTSSYVAEGEGDAEQYNIEVAGATTLFTPDHAEDQPNITSDVGSITTTTSATRVDFHHIGGGAVRDDGLNSVAPLFVTFTCEGDTTTTTTGGPTTTTGGPTTTTGGPTTTAPPSDCDVPFDPADYTGSSIMVDPSTAAPGDTVAVTGSGFPGPGVDLDISIDGVVVGSATTDANGQFSSSVVIPSDADGSVAVMVAVAGCTQISDTTTVGIDAGTFVAISGNYCPANSEVTLVLNGVESATTTADEDGFFSFFFPVPASTTIATIAAECGSNVGGGAVPLGGGAEPTTEVNGITVTVGAEEPATAPAVAGTSTNNSSAPASSAAAPAAAGSGVVPTGSSSGITGVAVSSGAATPVGALPRTGGDATFSMVRWTFVLVAIGGLFLLGARRSAQRSEG